MNYWRFALGRALIHIGLHVMPRGRARSDLYERFQAWGMMVVATDAARAARQSAAITEEASNG